MEGEHNEQEGGLKTIYEIGYLLLPTISEGEAIEEGNRLKTLIEEHKGTFLFEEAPLLRTLAYQMVKHIGSKNQKFDSAYFGWVKFEMTGDNVNDLTKKIEQNSNILRFLLVKATRENVFVNRVQKEIPIAQEGEGGTTEATPVDIDKSIDELVRE